MYLLSPSTNKKEGVLFFYIKKRYLTIANVFLFFKKYMNWITNLSGSNKIILIQLDEKIGNENKSIHNLLNTEEQNKVKKDIKNRSWSTRVSMINL
jgi:hypothetical protein